MAVIVQKSVQTRIVGICIQTCRNSRYLYTNKDSRDESTQDTSLHIFEVIVTLKMCGDVQIPTILVCILSCTAIPTC